MSTEMHLPRFFPTQELAMTPNRHELRAPGPDGRPLLAVERQVSVRDRCTVHVPDPRVDLRVAAAIAVGLDALMQR